MTKKQNTFYAIIGLIIGVIGGIAGTAFSMGAEQQKIKDQLIATNINISHLKSKQEDYKLYVEKRFDNYSYMITSQIDQLRKDISSLVDSINILHTDVQILKVIMQRMEKKLTDN